MYGLLKFRPDNRCCGDVFSPPLSLSLSLSLSLPLPLSPSLSLPPSLLLSLQLVLAVASMDVRIQASPSTPRLPSISSVGPTQTTLTHDVTEPPAISSQLPEV